MRCSRLIRKDSRFQILRGSFPVQGHPCSQELSLETEICMTSLPLLREKKPEIRSGKPKRGHSRNNPSGRVERKPLLSCRGNRCPVPDRGGKPVNMGDWLFCPASSPAFSFPVISGRFRRFSRIAYRVPKFLSASVFC